MSWSGKHPIGVTDATKWPTGVPTTGDEADNLNAARLATLEAGAGGAGTLAGEFIVTGSAVTAMTVSGLSLQRDLRYRIEVEIAGVSGTPSIALTYNADTTATNYDNQAFETAGGTSGGGRANSSTLLGSIVTDTISLDGAIRINAEAKPRCIYEYSAGDTTAVKRGQGVHTWRTGSTDVTSLTITSSVALAIGVGSFVRVWKDYPVQPNGANWGAFQLVKTETLTAAATAFAGISSLDLNSDFEYVLVWAAKNAVGSTNTMLLTYNGDTTPANYDNQLTTSSGATAGAARADTAKVGALLASGEGSGKISILKPPPSGNPRAHGVYSNGTGTGINDTKISHVWTGTANVTSIGFGGDQASGLAIGSWYALYRCSPVASQVVESLQIAVTDETTPITAGINKIKFRMPYAFRLQSSGGIKGSLTTAQASGGVLTVDVNEAGSSILSTKLTFDNTETTTVTAAAPPVLSDLELADDAEMSVDVDAIGTSGATGLKITLIGRRIA